MATRLDLILHKDRTTPLSTAEWNFVRTSVEGRIKRGTLNVWYDVPNLNMHVSKAGFNCYICCLRAHDAYPKTRTDHCYGLERHCGYDEDRDYWPEHMYETIGTDYRLKSMF